MNGNILIVTENPSNFRALKGIPSTDGHEVRPAANGDIALKQVAAQSGTDHSRHHAPPRRSARVRII